MQTDFLVDMLSNIQIMQHFLLRKVLSGYTKFHIIGCVISLPTVRMAASVIFSE